MTDRYPFTDPTDDAWLIEQTQEPTPHTETDTHDPDDPEEAWDVGGEG
jgi:hypothetical protein